MVAAFHLFSLGGYLACAYCCRQLSQIGWPQRLLAVGAILCQAVVLFGADEGGIHLRAYSLFTAIAMFTMFAMVMALAFDWRGNFPRSWLILAIVASLGTLLGLIPADMLETASSAAVNFHQILATLAYSLFILAQVQMLETFLRGKEISTLDGGQQAEPTPLLQMEGKVFTNVLLGFCLLTLTIASGIYAGRGQPSGLEVVSHKNIFAGLTWLACFLLILGRYLRGWRGAVALKVFVAANVFLFLSYLGTLAVLTLILDR